MSDYTRRCPKCRKPMRAATLPAVIDGVAFADAVVEWNCDACAVVIGRPEAPTQTQPEPQAEQPKPDYVTCAECGLTAYAPEAPGLCDCGGSWTAQQRRASACIPIADEPVDPNAGGGNLDG